MASGGAPACHPALALINDPFRFLPQGATHPQDILPRPGATPLPRATLLSPGTHPQPATRPSLAIRRLLATRLVTRRPATRQVFGLSKTRGTRSPPLLGRALLCTGTNYSEFTSDVSFKLLHHFLPPPSPAVQHPTRPRTATPPPTATPRTRLPTATRTTPRPLSYRLPYTARRTATTLASTRSSRYGTRS